MRVDESVQTVPDEGLVRAIGLGSAVLLVVGTVIGSGIFLTTGGMAALIPSAPLLLAAWALGGVLAITGGLTYAEMGSMFPRSGGIYVFLREAFGGMAAFLYGWMSLLVIISGAMAAVAVGFAEYLSFFIPALSTSNVVLTLPAPWGPFGDLGGPARGGGVARRARCGQLRRGPHRQHAQRRPDRRQGGRIADDPDHGAGRGDGGARHDARWCRRR